MIDTIKLCILMDDFKISDYDKFTPSAKGFFERPYHNFGIKKCNQNPTKEDLQQGIYKPRLTLCRKGCPNTGVSVMLIIEFSASKMLFSNNFDELETKDFYKLVNVLQKRLKEMSVKVTKKALSNALVWGVHFSKNIELDNCTSSTLINAIQKADVPAYIDLAVKDFRNGGHSVTFHTNTYELTFYDKVADLLKANKSEKRAIEKGGELQRNLLKDKDFRQKEVFRMEAKINNRRKLKTVLSDCGFKETEMTFKDLFDQEVAKKVLNYFWKSFILKLISLICLCDESPEIIRLKLIDAGLTPNKACKVLGLISLVKSSGSINTKEFLNSTNFARYKKELDLIEFDDNYLFKQFQKISKELQKMEPLKLNKKVSKKNKNKKEVVL